MLEKWDSYAKTLINLVTYVVYMYVLLSQS